MCYVDMDLAVDYYQLSKRTATKDIIYCFDRQQGSFKKNKTSVMTDRVPFINAYDVCLQIIKEYFCLPHVRQYKIEFEKQTKTATNKVVCFLWFFEKIDGCYDFERFESACVIKIIKKWCDVNNLLFTEPTVYNTMY